MRSFNLLFVIMSLFVVQQVQSADSAVMPESFFTVTLPYDTALQAAPNENRVVKNDLLSTQAQNGMVLGYKFKGKRFDCGSMDGFV